MMYMGKNSINITPVPFEPKKGCIVCQNHPVDVKLEKSITVDELNKKLSELFKIDNLTLISESGQYLYASNPPALYEAHKDKLEKKLEELMESKVLLPTQKIIVFSKSLNGEFKVNPIYS